MTLRRVLPYVIIVVLFAGIYWITMVVPTQWFYGTSYQPGLWDNKMQLQIDPFAHWLPFCLIIINVLEILTVNHTTFLSRLIKSLITVILCYLASAGIWCLLGKPKLLNLIWVPRSSPRFFCFLTMIYTLIPMSGIELLQRMVFAFVMKKNTIARHIPRWLRMDSPTAI